MNKKAASEAASMTPEERADRVPLNLPMPDVRRLIAYEIRAAVKAERRRLMRPLVLCKTMLENVHGRQLLISRELGGHVTFDAEEAIEAAKKALSEAGVKVPGLSLSEAARLVREGAARADRERQRFVDEDAARYADYYLNADNVTGLDCGCAATPPTYPVFRDTRHLPTCRHHAAEVASD